MSKTLGLSDYPKSDITKARKQCKLILTQDDGILPHLDPACVITVLVPVYNETTARLKQQVDAFAKQQFPKGHAELVFVVNNPKVKFSSSAVLAANRKAIRFLRRLRSDIRVHVLDRSSKGHELKFGNVGEARNFGIHVVANRYLDQNRDGLIIQVDADTIPSHQRYLQQVWRDFTAEKAFAAAGGVRFVLSMDSKNKKVLDFFKKHMPTLRNYMQWNFYLGALNRTDFTVRVKPTTFSGAHMIARAVAAVCAGGIRALNAGEDVHFGRALISYAEKRHATVLKRRDNWIVKTSLRESTRTASSFGPVFDNIKKNNGRPMVRSMDTPHYLDYLNVELAKFQKTIISKPADFNAYFGNGIELSPKDRKELMTFWQQLQGIRTEKKRHDLYEKTRQANRDVIVHRVFIRYFRFIYPQIPLTPAAFKRLKAVANKNPLRKAYVANMIKYYATFHLN